YRPQHTMLNGCKCFAPTSMIPRHPLIAPCGINGLVASRPAALDAMRPYQPAELFSADTPVVKGTSAEGWEPQVTYEITQTTGVALALKPDLAAAYFLRGWAVYLTDPSNPAVLAD